MHADASASRANPAPLVHILHGHPKNHLFLGLFDGDMSQQNK
jgi:hypothetical protein